MSSSEIKVFTFILTIALILITYLIIKKTNFLREGGKADSPFSWARSQLFMWTFLIICISVANWIVSGCKVFNLNDTCLVLLGITSASSVASMAVPAMQRTSKNVGLYAFKESNESLNWFHDILRDATGTPSMSRLQHVLFTFVYLIVFIWEFATSNGKLLPDFNDQAFLLMGISGGAYVINKSLSESDASNKSNPEPQPANENKQ